MKKVLPTIIHYLIIVIDIAIIAYLYIAMTAFNNPYANNDVCTDVKISIDKGIVDGFLDEGEVRKLLRKAGVYPEGKLMRAVDVRSIEDVLEAEPLLDDVECYKTQDNHVCLTMRQFIPILRILADDGSSYYIDEYGRIAAQDKYTTRLVVATGAITTEYASAYLSEIGNVIVKNEFWSAQIQQINVLDDGSIELIPRVGDHVVFLGQPTHIVEKLDRLYKFYSYGLSKIGWGQYSRISLDIENQIVCKKKS